MAPRGRRRRLGSVSGIREALRGFQKDLYGDDN